MVMAALVRRAALSPFVMVCASILTLTSAASSAAGPAVGVISTLAGTGVGGYNGDFTAATSAQISAPNGVAVDYAGNVYIADTSNQRVRKVAAGTGVITTVAGTGVGGFLGDGGVATAARLNNPIGVAVDAAGNLYIADRYNYRIRKVAAGTNIITTVAGSGSGGFGGDNGVATAALLNQPFAVAIDGAGNMFIADTYNHRIRMVAAGSGIITTLAGTGVAAYNGDGPATGASLYYPAGVAVDAAGNVYVADQGNARLRRITAGLISTVAGTSNAGYTGEAGPATAARLYNPTGVAVDPAGNVYIGDQYNGRVRKLTVATGVIDTVAGGGNFGFGGDGGEATAAQLNYPTAVAVDAGGTLFIADTSSDRVRKVTPAVTTRAITTIAGTGDAGYNGDGPAVGARLYYPTGVAVDAFGNTYIADQSNHRIRKVAAGTGIISTVAGSGQAGYLGENGPATSARLYYPSGIAVDTVGNLFIVDRDNQRIRKVTAATGIITTVAGSGVAGYVGDGGLATAAQLNYPFGVAVDAQGNLYIADENNHRVRKVTAGTGIITTVAGNGISGVGGDGGPATSAQLNNPSGVAVDSAGNIYIADYDNHRIRKVTAATGLMSTYAGTGTAGYLGEAGPATQARLNNPTGVAVDAAGNLYIADRYTYRVRMVAAGTGIITTIAGNGDGASGGDGGAATAGTLNQPYGVAVSATGGTVYIADTYNHRVRLAGIPLGPPTDLTARWLSATAIRLTWTPVSGATKYTVRRGTSAGAEVVIASNVASTVFDDPGRTPGATYYYVVTASNGGSDSGYSNVAPIKFARTGVNGDFDGDGRTDLAVFRPAAGQWFVRYSTQNFSLGSYGAFTWGLPGDLPITGDVDGDHRADLTVFRPASSEWLTLHSSQSYNPATASTTQWGLPGDVPIGGDFDGDRKMDLTVFRPSTGEWFVRYSSTGSYGVYQWGISGDVPLAADFDGDGLTDLVVYRPATSQWFVRSSSTGYNAASAVVYQWGLTADLPLVGDFDGDGRSELTVFRPSTNQWFIRYSTLNYNAGGASAFQWGLPGDTPLLLDLDADGKTELTMFRASTSEWLVLYSSINYNAGGSGNYQWGLPGDTPLPKTYNASPHAGDFEGDGKADLTVFRPSTGYWYVNQSQTGYNAGSYLAFQWGLAGDVPMSRDFDGDRLPDLAVYRPTTGEWFIRYSTQGFSTATYGYFQWGLPGDTPVAADLDGDGRAEIIVYRPASGQWFIRYSKQGYSTATYGLYQWGLPGDTPIAADFDGDGKAELTVYRPSNGQWFLLYSTQGYNAGAYEAYQVGQAGDVPLAGDFDGDGRADLTVFRPSIAHWLIRYSSLNFSAAIGDFQWGLPTDIPVVRDFDGDGLAELAVYRSSTAQWFVRYSLLGYGGAAGVFQWGLFGDSPVSDR